MKTIRWFIFLFVMALVLFAVPAAHAAPLFQAPQTTPLDDILAILLQLAQLAGVAALIAALVNVGKAVGIVKDTTAGSWIAGLNLVALGVLIYFHFYLPSVSLNFLDAQAAVLAQILIGVLAYVVQIFSSFATHKIASTMRLPLIGYSHSLAKT